MAIIDMKTKIGLRIFVQHPASAVPPSMILFYSLVTQGLWPRGLGVWQFRLADGLS